MLVKQRMRRDPVTVTEDEELSTALSLMLWNGVRHLPVVRHGTLVGVLSERDVLRGSDPGAGAPRLRGRVRDAMTSGAVIAHATEPLEDAAARMLAENVGCLPVIDGAKVAGILTTTDVLAEIATSAPPAREVMWPRVSDLMTADPVTAHADDRLLDAALRMVQRGVRHLPVVDGARAVVGILSDRDVRAAMGAPVRHLGTDGLAPQLDRLRVGDVMTPEPRVLPPDAPFGRLLALLVDERLGAVPVVGDHDVLVGIVSYVDVLRATAERRA